MELMQNRNTLKIEKMEKGKATYLKIGKYMLEYPQDHRKKKPIHKEVMKELKDENKDILDLSWGKYKRFKWGKVFRYIKETSIERVSAYGNTDNKILVELSRVTFHNLTYLDLRDCQLQNIETIPSGPSLNYLSLANNNIYTVKSLNKCQLSGLKTLLLNDNPISILGLQRCNFELETFWLQRKYNTKTIKESLCQASIFKLNSKQLKDISIESQKRIYQQESIKRVHEKYLQLERLLYIDQDFVDLEEIEYVNYWSDSEEEGMMVMQFNEQDQIEPPPLHNVQGEDQQDWVQEMEKDLSYNSQWSQSIQSQQSKFMTMSDQSWESK